MESKTAPFRGITARQILAATALTVAMSSGAFARTPPARDCDDVARELKSLTTPVHTLTVETVDHGPTDPDAKSVTDDATHPAATPLLRLAPRVSSALQEIFESDVEVTTAPLPVEPAGSPLAESEELFIESELDESVDSDGSADDDEFPLMKRKMYRIDI